MLNDTQIRRLIRHVCDKTGFSELSGDISFFFVESGSQASVVDCSHNGYFYKPSIKYYTNHFNKLDRSQQVVTVLQSACEAVNQYRIHQKRQQPKKYAVKKFFKQCITHTEADEETNVE